MKFINQLKFRIGEQYENYEFQLKPIKEYIENTIHYDVYYFEENNNIVLGLKTDKLELHYNADILEKVVCYFSGNQYEYLKNVIQKDSDSLVKQSSINFVSLYFENIEYVLSYLEDEDVSVFRYNRIKKT